jgi:microfibrillar-associated protein 1
MLKEKEELEKLRSMTEEERREYERRNPKEQTQKVKKKWKFMQKYYHKGAFFQVRSPRILPHLAFFVLIDF